MGGGAGSGLMQRPLAEIYTAILELVGVSEIGPRRCWCLTLSLSFDSFRFYSSLPYAHSQNFCALRPVDGAFC